MQPVWTRLSKGEAHGVLDLLSSHRDAVVFSKEATEVAVRHLPFYNDYKVYRLINYATMPTFSMSYLSNGREFYSLDGTASSIYTVNEKAPIAMTEMNVVPYLDFFFRNVRGSEGDIFLIKDPQKMPFADSLTPQQMDTLSHQFQPLKIVYNSNANTYKIQGTLYYGGGLIAATVLIEPGGKMSFTDQELLLTGIYFPDSPYTLQRAEG